MASASDESSPIKIILGSSSPARREILSEMEFEFTAMSADIDEKSIRREKPEELVKALAEAKAEAIKLKFHDGSSARDPTTLLITCDQALDLIMIALALVKVMVCQGIIRERPRSTGEAREFIKGYSGGRASAVNYVLVTNLRTGARRGGWDAPEVAVFRAALANLFSPHTVWFVEKAVKQGEMTCVAGGLKLTHPSVLPFIRELVGTTDSVRGLPRELTEKLIRESLQGN